MGLINELILLLVVGFAIATVVGIKYAEKHPGEAARMQVRAGQTIAGWLFKLFKGR